MLPGHVAQDQLWVKLIYNQPLDGQLDDCEAPYLGNPHTLFAPLASLKDAWPVFWPQIQPLKKRADARYALDFVSAFNGRKILRLFAHGPQVDAGGDLSNITWPTINGQHHGRVALAGENAPNDHACWYVAHYDYRPHPTKSMRSFEFVWANLDIDTCQSACSSWWVVRKANFDACAGPRINSALVTQAHKSTFPAPVIPLITLPARQFVCESTLTNAIGHALTPFARAGRAWGQGTWLEVAMFYRTQIAPPDADSMARYCDLPILIKNNIYIARDDTQTNVCNALAFATLVEQLADGYMQWFIHVMPPTKAAMLKLEVTLYSNLNQAPMALAPDLLISIPADGGLHSGGGSCA